MKSTIALFVVALVISSCGDSPNNREAKQIGETVVTEPEYTLEEDWHKDATIYEVNVRQHTPEGNFAAFTKDIPRISEMGIEILWLMPINPIGELNRKGELGSYYSIRDYKGINPEFGSAQDLKDLVTTAHDHDMKVIIDWVANHTSWDNPWTENDGWHSKDDEGNFHPPVADWSDVIQLNYDNKDMRAAMIDAMTYWITEFDIDGFRCDVAGMVPTDFWEEASSAIKAKKPQAFMLAEAEQPEHHKSAFNMSYSWHLMHIMNQIAMTEGLCDAELMKEKNWKAEGKTLESLDEYMAEEATRFPDSAYRMTFTSNHDENTWNGTVFERYGDANKLFATLAYTINGMPLLYSGMESGNKDRLEFFEKDNIDWTGYELSEFYSTLLHANRDNPALWNGVYGGDFKRIATSNDEELYAFSRTKGDNQVITVLNFSDQAQAIQFEEAISGEYDSIFNDQKLSVFTDGDMTLGPWGYQVFVKH